MRSRAHRLMPVMVLAGAFALAGCSGGDADDKPTGAKEAWLEGNKLDAELDQTVTRLVRQCMEGKGFTVHPYTGSDGEMWVFNPEEIISPEQQGPKLTVEEAQKNGYGMDPRGIKGPGTEGEGPSDGSSSEPEVSGSDMPMPSESGEALPGGGDPNAFYNLPEADQDRYWVAMEGVNRSKIQEEDWKQREKDGAISIESKNDYQEPDYPTFEKIVLPDGSKRQYPTQGCAAEVNAKIFKDGMGDYLETEYYALDKFSKVIWEELAETAEMQALDVQWADCMAGRGFDGLAKPEDAYQKASELYWGKSGDSGDGLTTVHPIEPEQKSDDELDKAREKEIKLAVAHAECSTETGYDDARSQLLKGALDTYLVDQETRLFHWYEYVKASLSAAQDLLKG
ncbi:hypothetical protein Afil01_13550 [Actinorhabdospora filicis]|uniref:Secreted protein n=1 Tax=Actinorhabdospora filicis TaxID=1785913 RepID=A0A9W6SHT9_9ACTN|nr:hypothetical protein [Actinorhabdospora filicis]GLZ76548.1 hypothetical protein Afil01_13550 [Actinorhabdospora filicis]